MKIKHKGKGAEKLRLPDTEECEHGHQLLEKDGSPTTNVAWNQDTGEPECAHCHAIDHNMMSFKNPDGRKECPKGHVHTHENIGLVMTKKGVYAFCKDCEKEKTHIKKAIKGQKSKGAMFLGQRENKTGEKEFYVYHKPDGPDGPEIETQNFNPDTEWGHIRRATKRGAETHYIHMPTVLKNTHGLEDLVGKEVAPDHYIPLRVGGWHRSDNIKLVDPTANLSKGATVPTLEEAQGHGMPSTVTKWLKNYYANGGTTQGKKAIFPVRNPDLPTSFRMKGFNPYSSPEFGSSGQRNPLVQGWVDKLPSSIQKQKGWDASRHPVFVQHESGEMRIHPTLHESIMAQHRVLGVKQKVRKSLMLFL